MKLIQVFKPKSVKFHLQCVNMSTFQQSQFEINVACDEIQKINSFVNKKSHRCVAFLLHKSLKEKQWHE